MKKEADEMRSQILATMKEHNIKFALAGDFNVTFSASGKRKIMWDEVPGSVQAELEKAKRLVPEDRLTVKEVKAP